MRSEIEKAGGLKLVYIDPPFDVGSDFSMDIEVGDDSVKRSHQLSKKLLIETLGVKAWILMQA
jgi:hypothetical protein